MQRRGEDERVRLCHRLASIRSGIPRSSGGDSYPPLVLKSYFDHHVCLQSVFDQLGLSAEQKARVQSLFDSMKAEAVPLGEKLLAQEAALDEQFNNRSVTPESLKAATAAIGVTQGELRDTHLKYHLQTAQVLSAEQMQHYSMLRGYGSEPQTQHHHNIQ